MKKKYLESLMDMVEQFGQTSESTRSKGEGGFVVLAQQNNIPIFDLWYPEVVERFNKYLEE